MATALSTTGAELIGFQSQLCRWRARWRVPAGPIPHRRPSYTPYTLRKPAPRLLFQDTTIIRRITTACAETFAVAVAVAIAVDIAIVAEYAAFCR